MLGVDKDFGLVKNDLKPMVKRHTGNVTMVGMFLVVLGL